tara:strand:+ start:7804 stop:8103 length:300 start_codon:yes stop_codon:yes gene_type:complete
MAKQEQVLSKLRQSALQSNLDLPDFTGQEAFAGMIGNLSFICTVDTDGQVELSLSKRGRRPSVWATSKVIDELDVIPHEAAKTDTTRHYVLFPGSIIEP